MDELRVRISYGRGLAAWTFAAAVALFAWLSGNSGVFPPDLWDEVAIAAGLRPPPSIMPGFWRSAVTLLVGYAGLENALFVLRALGPVSLGVLAALAYLFLGEMLPVSLRQRMLKWGWSRRIVNIVLMQGALCFVLSDPVWKAGRVLSPEMFHLLSTVFLLDVFSWSLRRGNGGMALLMAATAGLLAADTVFAFAFPVAFAMLVAHRVKSPIPVLDETLQNSLLRMVAFRRICVLFFFAWIGGVWINTMYFWGHGGLEAQDWTKFLYFMHYLYGYLRETITAAQPLGWFFIAVAAVAPLVLASALVGVATDDSKLLSYFVGFIFLAVGLFALIQSTSWTSAWFWRWGDASDHVPSHFLLCLSMLMTAATVTLSLCVVGVEFYFRSDNRIAQTTFADAVEGARNWERVVRSFRAIGRVVRMVLAYEPLIVLAILALPKFSTFERRIAGVVNDCIRQTAAECGSADVVFTDGMLDSAVEVAAALQGRKLKALSMISGSSPYEQRLRMRGETNDEDRVMLKIGASNTLRTWIGTNRDRASDIAVQVGLELWRRNGLDIPELGGLVARTAGFPSGEREKWVGDAAGLAERVIAIHDDGEPDGISNVRLRNMFTVVEWRLSRMCQERADVADRAGRADDAMRETAMAEALDDRNAAYGRVRDLMEWAELSEDMRLTPRENLVKWLKKGDFRLARVYASRLLKANPDDSHANFAMGMSYFVEEKYNRAEAYLKRSLVARPDEPAALNNLAIVQTKLGKYAEAETNAVKALKHLPGSKEVDSTLRYVRKLLEKNETS